MRLVKFLPEPARELENYTKTDFILFGLPTTQDAFDVIFHAEPYMFFNSAACAVYDKAKKIVDEAHKNNQAITVIPIFSKDGRFKPEVHAPEIRDKYGFIEAIALRDDAKIAFYSPYSLQVSGRQPLAIVTPSSLPGETLERMHLLQDIITEAYRRS